MSTETISRESLKSDTGSADHLTMTTPHAAEIAHDETLYDLLAELQSAYTAIRAVEARILHAATGGRYASHTSQVHMPDDRDGAIPHTSRYVKLADLPVGTIYWQAKTFTKGEGDRARTIVSVTETGRVLSRPTTLTEALAVVAADGPEAVALNDAKSAYSAINARIGEHEAHYTGWSRFFLVTSSSGHVHNGMNCSTCNNGQYATTYAPVVALSDHSEAEAVEALGDTLCSVCFPNAPVDGRPSKLTAAKARKLAAAGR